MKRKAILVAIFSAALIMCLFVAYGFASTSSGKGTILGKIFKKHKVDNEIQKGKILVEAKEVEITSDEIDYYKAFYNAYEMEMSDDEILDKLLKEKLLLKEAKDAGISVPDNEVKKYMAEIRENLPLDNEGYAEYKEFIKNSGWTEDEYWEKAFPVYKNAYIKGKYINEYLKPKFKEKNKDLSNAAFEEKFAKYLNSYKEKLISKYKIKTIR